MKLLIKQILLLCCCCACQLSPAQLPAFYHLSTAEGLSDNNVNTVARDRNGILWIGTTEGLNSFDGNRINTYHKYKYTGMADNNIDRILVDNENRVWLRSNTNTLSMLDEKRNIHLFTVGDSTQKGRVTGLLNSRSKGIIAFKGKTHFIWKNRTVYHFEKLELPFEKEMPADFRFITPLEHDRAIVYGDSKLLLIDYNAMKAVCSIPLAGITGLASINENELLAYNISGRTFYRISIPQRKVIKEYSGFTDQYQQPMAGNLRNIARISENEFVITTRFSGLYLLDLQKEKAEHWIHDPLDQRSIGGNNTYRVTYDTSGYLFVTTQTSGVHYFNVRQKQASSKPYFINDKKEIFDGYIQSVVTDKEGSVWMGAQDRLIQWNRKTGKTTYVPCFLPGGKNISGEETIRALSFDKEGNLWVGTSRYGVLVINKQLKTIAQLNDPLHGGKTGLPHSWINRLYADSKDRQWIGTLDGVCIADAKTFSIQDLKDHPVLHKVSRIPCSALWISSTGQVWIGTTEGAWCYDENKNSLTQYTIAEGLAHNTVLAVQEDQLGNIYFGTAAGLSVLYKNGTIKTYNRNNGLKNDRCEGILRDEAGYLWIGNLNCILRFDPATTTFTVYEEGLGFSHAGFRMRSCHRNESGEMFWGSDKGLLYFFPEHMSRTTLPLFPSINELQVKDNTIRFTSAPSLRFPYSSSSFTFHFSSGELGGGTKNHYLYRLSGFDNEWKKPLVSGQVSYNQLPPGDYRFEMKASRDGLNWTMASYPVAVNISKPWWQQRWFKILYGTAILAMIAGIYYYRQRRKRAREIQKTIDYFANSGYEHSSVDDILWDIARNCISRFNFEDCVIYLLDTERNMLVQKAAYGPKSPKAFEIINPIEIPVGKGIVGDVAKTGKAAVISNTEEDSRYIVDDERRLSEITIPIIHEGKVIGIIDSEHSRRNFFSNQHLKSLQTIASLCSAKISRAIAMDAMKKSRLEVMELNIKMAESKFLNLRLQMNPHFLFNSLSSIQHLIVSNQTTKAYKYLTVFSNFLRSLLKYAEKNFIPLDEELAILRMYIELESLRFDQSFHYKIGVDDSLTNDEVLVPSLMVQPFAENAIWHGLLHKDGDKQLSIHFSNKDEEFLVCTIEDNGIGRESSTAIRNQKISSMVHESRGIAIIKERLALLQQKTGKPAEIKIIDLYNKNNSPDGTRVVITIPFYNAEEL